MLKLIKQKAQISQAMYDHDIQDLITEELLSIIWNFRKKEYGCHYSINGFAAMCYTSPTIIKRRLKEIKDSGLVIHQRVYNNATRYWPSEKFKSYMEKGHNDHSVKKEKGQNRTVCSVKMTSYSSSLKEEEEQKQNNNLSFVRDSDFESRAAAYQESGYSNQEIERLYQTWKQINKK